MCVICFGYSVKHSDNTDVEVHLFSEQILCLYQHSKSNKMKINTIKIKMKFFEN